MTLPSASNESPLRHVTWLGGRTYSIKEYDSPTIPYRYEASSDDGHVVFAAKGSALAQEIEALLEESE
jgi:hypothetical protein